MFLGILKRTWQNVFPVCSALVVLMPVQASYAQLSASSKSAGIRVTHVQPEPAHVATINAKIEEALDQVIREANFQEVPFENVLDWLVEALQVNVLVDWDALEHAEVRRQKLISVSFKNIPARQAFWAISLKASGGAKAWLAFDVQQGFLRISTHEALNHPQAVRLYDLGPIIELAKSSVHAESDILPGGSEHRDDADQTGETPIDIAIGERIISIMYLAVNPDAWAENGGYGTLNYTTGILVVRQNKSTHREVEAFLNGLLEALRNKEREEDSAPSGRGG